MEETITWAQECYTRRQVARGVDMGGDGVEIDEDGKITFNELQDIVGFPAYYEAERKYVSD